MVGMSIVAVLAAAAALIHVWFFALESVLFSRPTVFRRFGLRSAEDAAIVRPMAFNQGFYNLFLALGIVVGARAGRRRAAGRWARHRPLRLRLHGRRRASSCSRPTGAS